MATPNRHIHDSSVFWLGTHTSVKSSVFTVPNRHIHDSSVFWLGTDTSVKSSVFKLQNQQNIFRKSQCLVRELKQNSK